MDAPEISILTEKRHNNNTNNNNSNNNNNNNNNNKSNKSNNSNNNNNNNREASALRFAGCTFDGRWLSKDAEGYQ